MQLLRRSILEARIRNGTNLLLRNRRLLLRKASVALKRRLVGSGRAREIMHMGPIIFPFAHDLDPHMAALCYGGYEPEIAVLVQRFLSRGMTFIDVGANIGYFSALALERVGVAGSVHAFEPVPYLCNKLKRLARLNAGHTLHCNNFALGDADEVRRLDICGDSNIGWNTLVPGFMPVAQRKESRSVCVRRLDDYLLQENVRDIGLIKIDVEGFEFPVLQGTKHFFERTDHRPPIICEVAPRAYSKLSSSVTALKHYMTNLGYTSYDSVTLKRLDLGMLSQTANVLFAVSGK